MDFPKSIRLEMAGVPHEFHFDDAEGFLNFRSNLELIRRSEPVERAARIEELERQQQALLERHEGLRHEIDAVDAEIDEFGFASRMGVIGGGLQVIKGLATGGVTALGVATGPIGKLIDAEYGILQSAIDVKSGEALDATDAAVPVDLAGEALSATGHRLAGRAMGAAALGLSAYEASHDVLEGGRTISEMTENRARLLNEGDAAKERYASQMQEAATRYDELQHEKDALRSAHDETFHRSLDDLDRLYPEAAAQLRKEWQDSSPRAAFDDHESHPARTPDHSTEEDMTNSLGNESDAYASAATQQHTDSAHAAALEAAGHTQSAHEAALEATEQAHGAAQAGNEAREHAEAAGQHEQDALTASQHAQESEQQATAASQHAQESEQQATTASQHAQESEQQATTASQHAQESEQQATTASQHAQESEQQASALLGQIQQLEQQAETATQHVIEAEQLSATLVGQMQGYEHDATALLEQTRGHENEAATSLEQARGHEGDAHASADQARTLSEEVAGLRDESASAHDQIESFRHECEAWHADVQRMHEDAIQLHHGIQELHNQAQQLLEQVQDAAREAAQSADQAAASAKNAEHFEHEAESAATRANSWAG